LKIDELISELEAVREEHGNLEVKGTVEPRIFASVDEEKDIVWL